jgi:hypothetical protein
VFSPTRVSAANKLIRVFCEDTNHGERLSQRGRGGFTEDRRGEEAGW